MMMDVWIIWMDAICLQSFRAKKIRERERESCAEGGGKIGMKSNWGQCSMTIHPHPHTHIFKKRKRAVINTQF